MIEKISRFSNPLTIIALFSCLAEVAGIVALGLVAKEMQSTFILFLIFFPTLLLITFFVTLNFNSKVLYIPSDFRADDRLKSSSKEMGNVNKVLGQALERAALYNLPETPWQAELVNRLHPFVATYLIKVANQRLSSYDHFEILRESFDVSRDDSWGFSIAAGLFMGILHSLGYSLFTYTKSGELYYHINISSSALSLLNENVNEHTQHSGR